MNFAFISLLASSVLFVACGEDEVEEPQEEVSDLIGTWKLAPEAGALSVGPAAGDYSWWMISADDIANRACAWDDTFTFNADGSFVLDLGTETWIEPWQGTDEGCGPGVAPHVSGTYAYELAADESTVKLIGAGAFIALAKMNNVGELGTGQAPAEIPADITYDIESLTSSTLVLRINAGTDPVVHWQFTLKKQ